MKRVIHRRGAEAQRRTEITCVTWGRLALFGLGRRGGRERRGVPSSQVSRQVADLFFSLRLRASAVNICSPQSRRDAEENRKKLCQLWMVRLPRAGVQREQRAQRGTVLAPPRLSGEHLLATARTPTGVPRRRVNTRVNSITCVSWDYPRQLPKVGVRSPSALSASSAPQAEEDAQSPIDAASPRFSPRLCASAVNKETQRRRVKTKTRWSNRVSGHAGVRFPSALSASSATQAGEGAPAPSDATLLRFSPRLCASAVNKDFTCP